MEFNTENIFKAIEEIAKNNFITDGEVIEIIKNAIFKTIHTKFDPDAELELIIDPGKQIFKVVNHTKMVTEDEDFVEKHRAIEIPLAEAKKIKSDAQIGDMISEEIDIKSYSKDIAGHVRQLLTQSVRERKKEAVYAKHKSLKGEMVEVTITSVTKTFVMAILADGTTAFMPEKFRNKRIKLNIGEKAKVFVEDVLEESKDSQIIISNGSPTIIKRILEEEVPEIHEGIIEVIKIGREPGFRTKLAVKTTSEEIDPIGSIVGPGGTRINNIIERLDGEKIDIIPYSEDLNQFVMNALSPAKVIAIFDKVNENGETIPNHKVVITPNRHQTLAIGKGGLNAKLAVELTNTRVDILSIMDAEEQGIKFEWNGNVSPEEVELIESGERPIQRSRGPRGPRPHQQQQKQVNTNDIMSSVNSFNEEITQEMSLSDEAFEDFEVDESMFSDDELAKFEQDFNFDSEIGDTEDEDEEEF